MNLDREKHFEFNTTPHKNVTQDGEMTFKTVQKRDLIDVY